MKILLKLLIFLSISTQAYAQEKIKEFKAQENLYLVGDRVFSLYYITSDGVVVIDPISEVIAEETMKSIKKHTDLPVKYVIYSHNHWDHNMGGKIYKAQGATFIAHQKAAENMTFNKRVVMPDSLWSGNQLNLMLGDKKIDLFFYGKNHGDGMTVFRFPEHNNVFTVDLVVPDRVLYAYLPDAKPKQWLEDLYKIRNMDFNQLLMAHVRPIGDRSDLNLQIRYFEDLYAATDKAIQDSIPFFDIPTTVKMPQYEGLLNYKEWLHMNVWRILMEKSIGQ